MAVSTNDKLFSLKQEKFGSVFVSHRLALVTAGPVMLNELLKYKNEFLRNYGLVESHLTFSCLWSDLRVLAPSGANGHQEYTDCLLDIVISLTRPNIIRETLVVYPECQTR